jgi:hypothetical protein
VLGTLPTKENRLGFEVQHFASRRLGCSRTGAISWIDSEELSLANEKQQK